MDPKQERALRDDTASVADQPRDSRKTTAVADVRVNQESGTPVDQMAHKRNGDDPGEDNRNPNLQTRDDQRPGPPSRAFSLDAARDAAAMPNAAPRPRPIAEAKRAGSTKGQVKDAPGRAAKAEKPKAQRTGSVRKPTNRTAAKRTGAGTSRAAPPKRATPKRAAAKRTGIRQRN